MWPLLLLAVLFCQKIKAAGGDVGEVAPTPEVAPSPDMDAIKTQVQTACPTESMGCSSHIGNMPAMLGCILTAAQEGGNEGCKTVVTNVKKAMANKPADNTGGDGASTGGGADKQPSGDEKMPVAKACPAEMMACKSLMADKMKMLDCIRTEVDTTGNVACKALVIEMYKTASADGILCGEIPGCKPEAGKCAKKNLPMDDIAYEMMMCIMKGEATISDAKCKECVAKQNQNLCPNNSHDQPECQMKVRAVGLEKSCRTKDKDAAACNALPICEHIGRWEMCSNKKPEVCTEEINPVCGADGVTYDNKCKAQQAGLKLWNVSPGACIIIDPVDPVDPVDGGDGCMPGGFCPMDLADAKAKWAEVIALAANQSYLTDNGLEGLGEPMFGAQQVVAGMNYRFKFKKGVVTVAVFDPLDGDIAIQSHEIKVPEEDLCKGKKCGEVCDNKMGFSMVMRHCQADGSCKPAHPEDCPDVVIDPVDPVDPVDGCKLSGGVCPMDLADAKTKWAEVIAVAANQAYLTDNGLEGLGEPMYGERQVVAGFNYRFKFKEGMVTVAVFEPLDGDIAIEKHVIAEQKKCPADCKAVTDGCNTCQCTADGTIGGCTRRACPDNMKKELSCVTDDKPGNTGGQTGGEAGGAGAGQMEAIRAQIRAACPTEAMGCASKMGNMPAMLGCILEAATLSKNEGCKTVVMTVKKGMETKPGDNTGGDGTSTEEQKKCPADCKAVTDGCNTCQCTADGTIGGCTKKGCPANMKKEYTCVTDDKPKPTLQTVCTTEIAQCSEKMGKPMEMLACVRENVADTNAACKQMVIKQYQTMSLKGFNCDDKDGCLQEAAKCAAPMTDKSNLTMDVMLCIMKGADKITKPECKQCVQELDNKLCPGGHNPPSADCLATVKAVAANKTCRSQDAKGAAGCLSGCEWVEKWQICEAKKSTDDKDKEQPGIMNCATTNDSEMAAWPAGKKAFCCASQGKGCTTCKYNKSKASKNVQACATAKKQAEAALSAMKGQKVCLGATCMEKKNDRRRLANHRRRRARRTRTRTRRRRNRRKGSSTPAPEYMCKLTIETCHPCYAYGNNNVGCRKHGKKACKFQNNTCIPNSKKSKKSG